MPIILHQTYETVSEESAANGEVADSGYDWQNVEHGFRETVELIVDGGFVYPSDSHGVPRWLSTEDEQDIQSGDYTHYSLHPGDDVRSQRYWAKACKAAGLVK